MMWSERVAQLEAEVVELRRRLARTARVVEEARELYDPSDALTRGSGRASGRERV